MTVTELARVLRTVRHLRLRQITGQLRHRLQARRPLPAPKPPPTLRIEAPSIPFLGAPSHAWTDGFRRFRLLNREVGFREAIDWDFEGEGPLWAYHLHQFDHARRESLAPEARLALLLDWIERHPDGIGWNPHSTSLRTTTWLKLMLTKGALRLDAAAAARLRASLGAQLRTLAARPELHLLANHYLSNLLALGFAGIVLEGAAADAWLRSARALRAELADQILADGMHCERSPMYHALLLEGVLDLLNVASAAPGRAPAGFEEELRDTAARMLGALRVLTHPDGEIALFADSAFGIAQPPAALEAYAAALGVAPQGPPQPGVLAQGGYVRLGEGALCVIASVAGPAPPHQPGHAHCDALSFELSVGGERVVTDTGVAEYIPGVLRERSRATRSHATLEVDGREQAELWAAHRVGGRPRVALVAAQPPGHAEATCAGWATQDTVHRRRFELAPERLEVCDAIEGRRRPVRLVLPLAPGLRPVLDGGCARLQLRSGARLRIELPEGVAFRIERGAYFPEFGRMLERAVLVGEAERLERAVWRLTLARRYA